MRANDDADRIAATGATQGAWDASLYDDGRASANAATALYVLGGVFAATGATLFIVDAYQRRHARSSVRAGRAGGAL